MITLTCDFCGKEITGFQVPDDCKRWLKTFNQQYLNKEVIVKVDVVVQEQNHICDTCAKKAAKSIIG